MPCNAAHKVADTIESKLTVPFLHIVDPTAQALLQAPIQKVGLLGTKVTMGEEFYKERLKKKWNIDVIVPTDDEQCTLDQILFQEVLVEKVTDKSKEAVRALLHNLKEQGAKGIILGCTELNLLIDNKDTTLPLFDTALLHAKAAVDVALSEYTQSDSKFGF